MVPYIWNWNISLSDFYLDTTDQGFSLFTFLKFLLVILNQLSLKNLLIKLKWDFSYYYLFNVIIIFYC